MSTKHQIIFLGPPGAGKGTQSTLLAKKLNIPIISTGNLLREAVTDGTELGIKAKGYLDSGQLVPDQLVIDLIREKVVSIESSKGFILDGFPRNISQADLLASLPQVAITAVVSLQVPQDLLISRLLERAISEDRSDDTEDIIKERLKVFNQQTSHLLDYYGKEGLLRAINGVGTTQEVHEKILSEIGFN